MCVNVCNKVICKPADSAVVICCCVACTAGMMGKQTCIGCSASADELLAINDISVDESEDLHKILGPLVEDGPTAALGRAHQQPGTALSPDTNKRQLLQTMKLAAPAIVKLQVWSVTNHCINGCSCYRLFCYMCLLISSCRRQVWHCYLTQCKLASKF